ncbi:hypothetical protein Celaphus_00004424, partial [Cervus elaphus hippelaphus]
PGPKPQLQAPSPTDPLRAFQPLTTKSHAGLTVLTPHLPLLVPHLREAPPPLSPGEGPEAPHSHPSPSGLSLPVLNALVPAPSPSASLAIRATRRPTQGWSEINISSVRCAWGGSTLE